MATEPKPAPPRNTISYNGPPCHHYSHKFGALAYTLRSWYYRQISIYCEKNGYDSAFPNIYKWIFETPSKVPKGVPKEAGWRKWINYIRKNKIKSIHNPDEQDNISPHLVNKACEEIASILCVNRSPRAILKILNKLGEHPAVPLSIRQKWGGCIRAVHASTRYLHRLQQKLTTNGSFCLSRSYK